MVFQIFENFFMIKLYSWITLIAIFFICYGCSNNSLKKLDEPIAGSWGDQGNGTFNNPILNSNYPDSDVEKFGDKWYMISSKGRYMPGMTVLESEDLVNWQIIGGVVDSVDWGDGRGVWAGDLAYHNDHWYCYFIDIDKGLFFSKAENIKGPWTKPHLMLEKTKMTDPAVYWDYANEKAYLMCNYDIVIEGKKKICHNRIFELSWDGTKLLNEGKEVYVHEGAEAAKIYNINNFYYILISEWTLDENGRRDRRQIVLRSKDIYGPYERKVVLERDEKTMRSCCQGSLIETSNGNWWYMHQLVQSPNSYEGRPQFIIPVKWENNWPVFGHDPDGNGIGNTMWHCEKPVQGKPIVAPQTDDDFNSATLGHQWLWNNNPDNSKWSLNEKKGHIRLSACIPSSKNEKIKSLPNKLLQRKIGRARDTVITKMDISGMEPGHKAGLIHTAKNYFTIGVSAKGNKKHVYVDINGGLKMGAEIKSNYIWLKSIVNGQDGHFEYSTDGKDYTILGQDFFTKTQGFNGVFIGLYSMNDSGKGYVDYDWFHYTYDGPKSEMLSALD